MSAGVIVWVYIALAVGVVFSDSLRGERPSHAFWALIILANLWMVAGRLS